MKIAIISDSHDNVVNLEKIIKWLNNSKISVLIHAGDLSAPSVLVETISPKYKGKMHMILGNVGDEVILENVVKNLPNVKYYGKKGDMEIDGRKIVFVHTPKRAEKIAFSGKYNLIVFGHTHQAEIKEINGNLMLNPGTSGGLYNKATFAIYDTEDGKIEIIEVDKL